MSPPPKHLCRDQDLEFVWDADPFDTRFVENTARRHLTDLGLLLNIASWIKHNPHLSGLPAFQPVLMTLRRHLMRRCPDAWNGLKIIAGESKPPSPPSWKKSPPR